MTTSINKLTLAVTIIFSIFLFWWILLQFLPINDIGRPYFEVLYGTMALCGAASGLAVSQKWGMTKSVFGKAIIFFSLGLLAQEFGQIIESYYRFYLQIPVPYPSYRDIGYFGSIPLYIIAMIYLAKAAGIDFTLKPVSHQIGAFAVSLTVLLFSYFIFLQNYFVDYSQPIKIFFDFGYPFGQAIYVSIALTTYLLSRYSLGGVMKNRILLILLALFVQYLADYSFLFQSKQGYYLSTGSTVDLFYLLAYFIMAFALSTFAFPKIKLKDNL